MGVMFSGNEAAELGIEIEKNGKAFYERASENAKNPKAKEIFKFLAGEEDKHISAFQHLIKDKDTSDSETYPDEYAEYLKNLADMNVFVKKDTGAGIADKAKNETEVIDLAIGFEKDSILLFHEMEKVISKTGYKTVEELIKQEQKHVSVLIELKKTL
jgi:rubrerythrin